MLYFQNVEVELPAGALPPGPATAELIAAQQAKHVIRFTVDGHEPTPLRLYRFDYRSHANTVVARSEVGTATWQGDTAPAASGRLIFAGSSEQHGELVHALSSVAERDPQLQHLGGLTVVTPAGALRGGCKSLLDAELVVAVTGVELDAEALLACVARGSNVVALTGEHAEALASLPKGRPVYWGAGAIAIVSSIDAAAAQAGPMYFRRHEWLYAVKESLVSASRYDEVSPAPARDHGPRGSHVILLVIGAYIAAIVVLGVLVARRARPAWLGWGWFPALSLAVAVVLALIGSGWGTTSALAVDTEVRVLAPTRGGLGLHSFRISTAGSEVVRFEVPWTETSVIKQIERSHRFDSPFASSRDGLVLREDLIGGRFTVENLALNRRDSGGLVWRQPLPADAAPMVRIERRADGELWASHRSPRPLGRTLVCTRAGELQREQWLPAQPVRLDVGPGKDRYEDRDSVFRVVRTMLCERQPTDSVVTAVELPDDGAAHATLQPAFPVRRRVIELTIGPSPSEPISQGELP